MNVAVVTLLLVAAIFMIKVACEVAMAEKKEEHKCNGNCGCDGNCGDNCKCKDK